MVNSREKGRKREGDIYSECGWEKEQDSRKEMKKNSKRGETDRKKRGEDTEVTKCVYREWIWTWLELFRGRDYLRPAACVQHSS